MIPPQRTLLTASKWTQNVSIFVAFVELFLSLPQVCEYYNVQRSPKLPPCLIHHTHTHTPPHANNLTQVK